MSDNDNRAQDRITILLLLWDRRPGGPRNRVHTATRLQAHSRGDAAMYIVEVRRDGGDVAGPMGGCEAGSTITK
jgi:hypothetical protein